MVESKPVQKPPVFGAQTDFLGDLSSGFVELVFQDSK